jgi:L-fuculose-phosphate aldolase
MRPLVGHTEPDPSGDAEETLSDSVIISEMVLACQVLHAANLSDTVWGFVAARDSLERGVWVTRDNVGLGEISSDDVILVAYSGEVVAGIGDPDNECAPAFELMAMRHDIHAVVHVHSVHATAFTAAERTLLALSHEGCHLVPPDIARAPFTSAPGITSAAVRAFALSLGQRNASLVPGHGLVTTAETLGESVALAIYLDKACRLQLIVGDVGHTIPDAEIIEKRSGQLSRPLISWEYLRRTTSAGDDTSF